MKKVILTRTVRPGIRRDDDGAERPSTVDVLGAHNNGGRGCAGCHSPHSGSFGSGHKGAADSRQLCIVGTGCQPTVRHRRSRSAMVASTPKFCPAVDLRAASAEVGGILLCLSCHDGNVTASNMMANQSYEQRIGLLTNTAYGSWQDSDLARQ